MASGIIDWDIKGVLWSVAFFAVPCFFIRNTANVGGLGFWFVAIAAAFGLLTTYRLQQSIRSIAARSSSGRELDTDPGWNGIGCYQLVLAVGGGVLCYRADPRTAANLWLPIATLVIFTATAAWAYLFATIGYEETWVRGRARVVAGTVGEPREDDRSPVEARPARLTFADIHGMRAVKEKLFEPAQTVFAPRAQGKPPRNGILLTGEPGNGKTALAEALAGELGVPIIVLTVADVESKWLGERGRAIKNTCRYARSIGPCVFFMDEIDSFISSRDGGPSSHEQYAQATNVLLTELVQLRNYPVLVIGATNFPAKLDAAAIREGRFDFKVEVTPPDEEARIGLLRAGLGKYAPGLATDDGAVVSIAKRWGGFSVVRINAVAEELPAYVKEVKPSVLGFKDLMDTLRRVQGRNGKVPNDTKPLSEMALAPEARDTIDLFVARLRDPYRMERLGGTMPNGILFSGPPGTGKTATARAIAKEVQYAFLSTSGPDLMSDMSKLEKIYSEAKDLRPTIVFIDEADGILKNREYSNNPEPVNKLLTLLDGTEEKVKDVIFIAATNHPDRIDPALLRAGRFTEKVDFQAPDGRQVASIIQNWMVARKLSFQSEALYGWIEAELDGQSVANIEGVLQQALNRAIATEALPDGVVGKKDLEAALRTVLSQVA